MRVTRRLDGKKFAPSVARKTRGVLFSALDHAVEKKLIDANPLPSVKWTAVPFPVRSRGEGIGSRQPYRAGVDRDQPESGKGRFKCW